MASNPFKAIQDKVIIEPDAAEDAHTTESGIYVEQKLHANSFGNVLAVGEDCSHVQVGDRVVYSPTHFDEIEYQKIQYHVLAERDVYAIIEA